MNFNLSTETEAPDRLTAPAIQPTEPIAPLPETPAIQVAQIAPCAVAPRPLTTMSLPSIDKGAWEFCQALSHSQLVPANLRSTEVADHTADLYMLMLMGASLGLTFAQSITGIYVIPNTARPALYTATKRALVIRAGGVFEIEEWSEKQLSATVTIRRGGNKTTRKFGVIDAAALGKMYQAPDGKWAGYKGANGHDTPWTRDWRGMCLTRAISRCCDAAYPDVLMGLATAEEVTELGLDNAETPVQNPPPAVLPSGINPNLRTALKQ